MMKIRRWFLLIAMLLLSLAPLRADACDGEVCPGKILCCIGGTEERLPL
jgi:hypothetical protein